MGKEIELLNTGISPNILHEKDRQAFCVAEKKMYPLEISGGEKRLVLSLDKPLKPGGVRIYLRAGDEKRVFSVEVS